MALVSERATIAEKANAWDMVMRDTRNNLERSLVEAWRALETAVIDREARENPSHEY